MDDIIQDLQELEKEEGQATETEETVAPTAEEPAETPAEEPAQEETPAEQPAEQPTEPAQEPVVEPEPQPVADPEPILGKFKTQDDLIKAYQNLEKQLTKKSQQVAETAKVQSDDFDKLVQDNISNAAWGLINNAVNTIVDPEQHKEALYALEMYRRTGDGAHLEKAREFLDPRVDRRLEVDFMNQSAAIRQEANKYRDEIEMQPVREALEELEEEDPDWLADETHQNLIAEAIKLNRKVDVKGVKAMIKAVEEKAVERYKATEAKRLAQEAERKPIPSVKTSERQEPVKPKKDWREMSIAEQLAEEMDIED
jgi:hypothetical protein